MSVLGNYNVEIDVNAPARSDKIAQPPKKWRNWYKATRDGITKKARRVVKLGDIYPGFDVFPSKELAEEYILKTGCKGCVYLGAEPEADAS